VGAVGTFGFEFQTAKTSFRISTVIASEAKQSMVLRKERVDCFVATLLAMTAKHTFAFSRRNRPEFCSARSALSSEGAGNAGRLVRPQRRVQG
jgi:hypothetical protein